MAFLNIIIIPELFFITSILTILLVSTFLKTTSFKFSFYSSIIILIILSVLIIVGNLNTYLNYEFLFTSSPFINLFKILIIVSTILCLLISEKYFEDLELERFEIPILILFSVFGMMIMISSNNLMSMYLGIELQSLSLYVLASVQRNSLKSSESGLKYFVLGALASAFLLYGCSLIYGFTGATNFENIKDIIRDPSPKLLNSIWLKVEKAGTRHGIRSQALRKKRAKKKPLTPGSVMLQYWRICLRWGCLIAQRRHSQGEGARPAPVKG